MSDWNGKSWPPMPRPIPPAPKRPKIMIERQKLRGGCSIPNVEGVVDLLQRFGVWGLGGCDGCECAHFKILGISVDVSCHKSEHCVRVHSGYLGFNQSELAQIAREVLAQLTHPESYSLRFCEYSYDHKNGRWENGVWKKDQACCYCGQLRPDADAYLCDDCFQQNKGLDVYPANLNHIAKAIIFEFQSAGMRS